MNDREELEVSRDHARFRLARAGVRDAWEDQANSVASVVSPTLHGKQKSLQKAWWHVAE